jgi:hypothetical protein
VDASLLEKLQADTPSTMRRASLAMADAHRRFHGAGGWNKCELDPCHTVGVALGELALYAMAAADLPGDDAG